MKLWSYLFRPGSTDEVTKTRASQMPKLDEESFWHCVWTLRGSITPRIMPHVLIFGIFSAVWVQIHWWWPHLALEVGPIEVAGGALGMLLVVRTNAGYDRWWEARKLWGSLVNVERSMVTGGLAYGPESPAWQKEWVHWCVTFAHISRLSLRGDRNVESLKHLLSDSALTALKQAHHMPTYVAQRLADLIQQASLVRPTANFAYIEMEQARQHLMDCIGGCERIASTPLPRVYVLKIRRFAAIYLFAVPLALVDKVGLATPLLVMLLAYPVLGMDRIAQELQSPFSLQKLSHLPLDLICQTIENNALYQLHDTPNHRKPT